MARSRQAEDHYVTRIGWLRAAVLGANDGIVSTASLIVGVASAAERADVLLAGAAGLVAGAMSMAAGEFVSVSSQADTERADIARERVEIADDPQGEMRELAAIYEGRGLSPDLAREVARELTARDPLAAHMRDELGLSDIAQARPLTAAMASATSFVTGAALPLATAALAPAAQIVPWVMALSLVFLGGLGAMGARTGGARVLPAVLRVAFWGAVAMAITAAVGRLFGAAG
ncbi:MAG: VIT family protein [Paracoccaceae bacterium]